MTMDHGAGPIAPKLRPTRLCRIRLRELDVVAAGTRMPQRAREVVTGPVVRLDADYQQEEQNGNPLGSFRMSLDPFVDALKALEDHGKWTDSSPSLSARRLDLGLGGESCQRVLVRVVY